jgi:large subunit ribosomal protein L24
MSQTGTRIRHGDTVRVITGKDVGKEGKVLRAIAPVTNPKKPRPSRLVVEGINEMIKHQRPRPQQNVSPSAKQQESGRITLNAPIYASKVMLVCPNCAKPTRIGVSVTESGERYRTCKHCEKRID